jgi:tetratricopeptide (TPR) repeat protein
MRIFFCLCIFVTGFSFFHCSTAKMDGTVKSDTSEKERTFSKRFDDPVLNLVVYNGWTHYHEGRYDNARNDFERLLATGHMHYDVLFGAGISSYMMADYNNAVSYFSRCIKQRSDHFEAVYFRAESYRALKEASRAVSDYMSLDVLQYTHPLLCGALVSDNADEALLLQRRNEARKKMDKTQ